MTDKPRNGSAGSANDNASYSRSRRPSRTSGVTRPVPARTSRPERHGVAPVTPGPVRPTGTQPAPAEAALAVWASIVGALENADLRDVGPEYLKLSRLLTEQRAQELLGTGTQAPEWEAVQRLAIVTLELLAPLVEAAELLTADPHQAMGALRRSSSRARDGAGSTDRPPR